MFQRRERNNFKAKGKFPAMSTWESMKRKKKVYGLYSEKSKPQPIRICSDIDASWIRSQHQQKRRGKKKKVYLLRGFISGRTKIPSSHKGLNNKPFPDAMLLHLPLKKKKSL